MKPTITTEPTNAATAATALEIVSLEISCLLGMVASTKKAGFQVMVVLRHSTEVRPQSLDLGSL